MNLALVCRRLLQQPGFTAAVGLTLALGIGSTVALFAVADAVLLRPLAYDEPGRLVMVEGRFGKLGLEEIGATPGQLSEYQRARSFAAVAAFRSRNLNLAGADEPERVSAAQTSAALFPLLRATPQLGRALRSAEERPGADGVVVLSDRLWRRRFAADPAVLGRAVRLDGQPRVVVGVMPAGFEFPHPSYRFAPPADLWLPLALGEEARTDHASYELRVVARLRDGAALAGARAEMAAVAARLEREHPRDYRGPGGEDGGWGVGVVPLREVVVGGAGRRVGVLLGAVGLLLAIACANVAALQVARSIGRRRELAVRMALGARRGDLAREALAESSLLALAGGALGALLASGLVRLLVTAGPASLPRLAEVSLDGRALGFALLLSLATALLFSVAGPLAAADARVRAALPSGIAPASRRGEGRGRQLLVVGQVALALVLLGDAGLLLRSLHRLQTAEAGFAAEHRVALELTLPSSRYPEAWRRAAFFDRLRARVASLPGIDAAGLVTQLPLSGRGFNGPFSVEGRPLDLSGPPPSASYRSASPEYFPTIGIARRRGRLLADRDAPPGAPAAVVNETMARQFFAGEEPLGRRLKLGAPGSPRPWLTIVGIVADVSDARPGLPPSPEIYVHHRLEPDATMSLVVHASGDPAALAAALRAAVRAEDPDQAISSLRPLDELRAESVAPQRLAAALLGGFALLALALTAVGVYGVAAQLAGQRTRELGVRVALGAGRHELLRLLLGQSLAVAAAGTLLGLAAALASARLLAGLLEGVPARDPATLAAAAGFLLALALFAGWLPARRASRLDPALALRRD